MANTAEHREISTVEFLLALLRKIDSVTSKSQALVRRSLREFVRKCSLVRRRLKTALKLASGRSVKRPCKVSANTTSYITAKCEREKATTS